MEDVAMVEAGAGPPLGPPALADGGEADDWSGEVDDASPTSAAGAAEPGEVTSALPPVASQDGIDKLRSDLHSLHLESNVNNKEMDAPEEVEEMLENEESKKRHLNVVFIGHVDAGKSTIGGQILLLSGQVDERTIQKYEKEAKDKSRESWYMAYIMDTNEEERVKGITVEVGRARFETENTRFTILDAPKILLLLLSIFEDGILSSCISSSSSEPCPIIWGRLHESCSASSSYQVTYS